jgi:hypothetical protein
MLESHVNRAAEAGRRLFHAFQGDGGGVFGTKEMPEDLPPRGAVQGSREHLLFLTFTVAIDYQRDAAQLWAASRAAFEAETTRYLYDPSVLARLSVQRIEAELRRLQVSRKHGPDALTWQTVGRVLHERFGGDPLELVKACGYDAPAVLETIRRPPTRIRFLAGDKIGPLWVRMLHDNGGVLLRRMNALPIPVDVHVARSTLAIGAVAGLGLVDPAALYPLVQETWARACEHAPFYALRLDEPLWQQSRLGCTNRSDTYCPMIEQCLVADLCVEGRIRFTEGGVELSTAGLRPMLG